MTNLEILQEANNSNYWKNSDYCKSVEKLFQRYASVTGCVVYTDPSHFTVSRSGPLTLEWDGFWEKMGSYSYTLPIGFVQDPDSWIESYRASR